MKQRHYLEVALCSILCHIFVPQTLTAGEEESHIADHIPSLLSRATELEGELKEGLTINFNNVAITEYLRFISKMLNVNFVFDEQDMQFNVSIISEEPISPQNVLATLVQVLRIHNLSLLEQEGNFLITSNKAVNQIPTIVSAEGVKEGMGLSPLITRVFRIRNASLDSVANILRPMISQQALLEVSKETGQLIITDVTVNIEKIATLLSSLDTPHTSIEIDAYVAKHIAPSELIPLATQLVTPFSDGNTFLLVPQSNTNTIFIISTPALIERTLSVMEDLDMASKEVFTPLSSESIFLYKIQARPPQELMSSLQQIASELQDTPAPPAKLVNALTQVRWISTAGSLLFISDADTLAKIKEMMVDLDTAAGVTPATFYIYKLQQATAEQMEHALRQLSANLSKSPSPNTRLIAAIESMEWIRNTNSLTFTGDEGALKQLAELLPIFDTQLQEGQKIAGAAELAAPHEKFYLYKLERARGDAVLKNLHTLADNLSKSKLANADLIATIRNIQWIKENNILLITGSVESIEELKLMIADFDLPPSEAAALAAKSSFFIYKPAHKNASEIQSNLQDIAKDLTESGLIDPQLLETIASMRYVPSTNSLLFTGSSDALEKVKELISRIDIPEGAPAPIQQIGELTFFIYKLQYVSASQLISSLKAVASDLEKAKTVDKELGITIANMKWIQENNSILFTGPKSTLEKVEQLVLKFDIPSLSIPHAAPITPRETPSSFVLYTPRYQGGEELICILCDFENNLIQSGVVDKGLFDAINNLKWIEKTHSLLISGDQPSIAKVQELLQRFDTPTEGTTPAPEITAFDNTSFLVYKLQYHQGGEIQSALKQIAVDLGSKESVANQDLMQATNSLQWIKITNSLLATGAPATLSKLRNLIQNIDVPLRQVFIEVLVLETSLTNTQNFGLQWGGKIQYLTKASGAMGNFPATSTITPPSGQVPTPGSLFNLPAISNTRTPLASDVPFTTGFDLGVIGDIIMHKGKSFISLGSLVNALQTDTDSQIVMNPKIITQDNQNSTIFVGQNIPFVGSLVTSTTSSQTTTTSLEYRDIGVSLSLTPVIGNNNIVTIDIAQDISEVVGTPPILNSAQVSGIQSSHTSMSTRVQVPDNHFVVLSGMIQDTKTHFKSQIPCLGGLPVIGAAFSENDRLVNKANILIFLRPHIIDSYKEYDELTKKQEDLYKDSASLPVLKEEIDAGLDMVKPVDSD